MHACTCLRTCPSILDRASPLRQRGPHACVHACSIFPREGPATPSGGVFTGRLCASPPVYAHPRPPPPPPPLSCAQAMLAALGFVVGEQLEDFPAFMNWDGSVTGPVSARRTLAPVGARPRRALDFAPATACAEGCRRRAEPPRTCVLRGHLHGQHEATLRRTVALRPPHPRLSPCRALLCCRPSTSSSRSRRSAPCSGRPW